MKKSEEAKCTQKNQDAKPIVLSDTCTLFFHTYFTQETTICLSNQHASNIDNPL